MPVWATPEVVTGGFATGRYVAGGALEPHERSLLEALGEAPVGGARRALNEHFVGDPGFGELLELLESGRFEIAVPEEGALLTVAWLANNGHADDARSLTEQIAPFFDRLRFYPIPREQALHDGPGVHVQTVGETIESLRRIAPNRRVLQQKTAVEVWIPFYDRVVGLFLETVDDGWPCRRFPADWNARANKLLGDYHGLRLNHGAWARITSAKSHPGQLLRLLAISVEEAGALSGPDVGRIRLILNRYVEKRGVPGSATWAAARQRQQRDVSAPSHYAIAGLLASRLGQWPRAQAIEDVNTVLGPVSMEEFVTTGLSGTVSVPATLVRKVRRCVNLPVDELVALRLITSGEALARCLPQISSGIRALGIRDPHLRRLHAAIYRAFRRRRSLLLTNLEAQVRIEEVPWIASIERLRRDGAAENEAALQTLRNVSRLALTSFPHALLPNKLLQELRALADSANLDIPLLDELAADIFMGEFSPKFVSAACRAAELLKGTLYAKYYGIDYEAVRNAAKVEQAKVWARRPPSTFATLCASRAGVGLGGCRPAINGMVIEQQQILTTQNLAVLFSSLRLIDAIGDQLGDMARHCFSWICRRQQVATVDRRARLKMIKNTAYGWRQMIFYLSLLDDREVAGFLDWAANHLRRQGSSFQYRFAPAFEGLVRASRGEAIESAPADGIPVRRFLGWSNTRHWLLDEAIGR